MRTLLVSLGVICACVAGASGDDLMVESFESTGQLTFSTVSGAQQYKVEWSSAAGGPWTNFAGASSVLDAIAPSNTSIMTVSVPMFYRVKAEVTPFGPLVVNEIDYDQLGADTGEFVEIYNAGPDAISLAGYRLELVNGAGGSVYETVDLSVVGSALPGNGYLVVGNQSVVDSLTGVLTVTISSGSIQNGPDGVHIVYGAAFVDGVAYEGTMPGVGEGTAAATDSSSGTNSIQRIPNGWDTDDNGADFQLAPSTPGAANQSL